MAICHEPASSAIRRRNPRPRNVMPSKAGLLACGSLWRLRPSQASCESSVTQNGATTRRLQLRGQRRTLPEGHHRLPVLAPPSCLRRGTSTGFLQQHREAAVKRHIKISLYASAERRPERFISGWKWSAFQLVRTRPQPRGGGDLLVRPRPFGRLPASEPALRDRQECARPPKPRRWGWRSERSAI